jgi:probable HAF family extracellular repeat protein
MSGLRQLRNFWIPWITTIVLACFSHAAAQTSYRMTDLGTVGTDNESMIMSLNNEGLSYIMAGNVGGLGPNNLGGTLLNGRAYLGIDGFLLDLGTLGGQNTWMNWGEINDWGQIVGYSETNVPDPNGEDICGFGTYLTCLPFLWQFFHMSALPTLGGNNGQASAINDLGQIVGMAENGKVDSTCPPGRANNRIQLPAVWKNGGARAQALPTGSNPDGFAFWNNDQGQVVGYTSTCGGATIYAASWKNNTLTTLPDFGTGSLAIAINNPGVVAGTVGSADNTTQYGAVWTNDVLTSFGLLPGDFGGEADSINSRGQVVGGNWDSNFYWNHAFIWQNGVMTDLNTLIPYNANLYAVFAAAINDRGQIGGQAVVISGPEKGNIHSFLATPVNQSIGMSVADFVRTHPRPSVPANVGNQSLQRSGLVQAMR